MRAVGWEVETPPGWEAVAGLCRAMYDDRSELVARINGRLSEEIAGYHPDVRSVSDEELRWATYGGVQNWLRGIASRQPLGEQERAYQWFLGVSSAERGVPPRSLISAYHLGFRELWDQLARRAIGTPAADLLLEHGSIAWERLVDVTNAVADGYQHEMERRAAWADHAAANLLDLLESDPNDPQVRPLAEQLGLDPARPVVALAASTSGARETTAVAELVRHLGARASVTATTGRVSLVLVQDDDATLRAALEDADGQLAVGIGRGAPTLIGARTSIGEARAALVLSMVRGRPCAFADDWLAATLAADDALVARMLGPAIAVAGAHPHLAEAVESFAAAGFSIAEAARRLHVSPNSLRYRLRRWRELTSFDPFSFDGLVSSALALRLSPAG